MVSVKTWTEISSERLAGNFAALQQIAAEHEDADAQQLAATVLAVVKANAYGHGIDPCAPILARAGAEWLGVTDAVEGVELRRVLAAAGMPGPQQPRVLVMCGTACLPGEAERIVQNRLTPVVWSAMHIERLVAAVREAGLEEPVAVHLEIDSGMTRQGALPGPDLENLLAAIAQEPLLRLDGVFTHFASTEVAHSPQTSAQQSRFDGAIDQIAASGLSPDWVHAGNSSYLDNASGGESPLRWLQAVAAKLSARAMVRSGIALYGYLLPIASSREGEARSLARSKILPVMTWKTRVIAVSKVAAGAAVGYNGTFITERPMRLALLPVGYADGMRRDLSSSNAQAGGWIMIHGRPAPVIGRISMNLTTVDVSAIDGVAQDDEAVLLGDGITADDHARLAGTIPYEILCGVRAGPEGGTLAGCGPAKEWTGQPTPARPVMPFARTSTGH